MTTRPFWIWILIALLLNWQGCRKSGLQNIWNVKTWARFYLLLPHWVFSLGQANFQLIHLNIWSFWQKILSKVKCLSGTTVQNYSTWSHSTLEKGGKEPSSPLMNIIYNFLVVDNKYISVGFDSDPESIEGLSVCYAEERIDHVFKSGKMTHGLFFMPYSGSGQWPI